MNILIMLLGIALIAAGIAAVSVIIFIKHIENLKKISDKTGSRIRQALAARIHPKKEKTD